MSKAMRKYLLGIATTAVIILSYEFLGHILAMMLSTEAYLPYAMALILLVGIVLLGLKLKKLTVVYFEVTPLRTERQKKKHSKKGLIVFLSLYKHFDNKLTNDEIRIAAENKDYETLGLSDYSATALGHQLLALETHKSSLEHCWIISTKNISGIGRQSHDYVGVFEKYVKERISSNIKIHSKDYSIILDNAESICFETYQMVKEIYAEARKEYKFNSREIITDVTGGILSMSIGALMACIGRDEDVQYIGAQYDNDGHPTKGALPVVVKYIVNETEIE